MIKEALMDNDFLKNLSSNQVREIVDYMEIKKVPTGAHVIREGDSGKKRFIYQSRCAMKHIEEGLEFVLKSHLGLCWPYKFRPYLGLSTNLRLT